MCQRIWSVVIRRVLRLAFILNQMSLSKDVILEALEFHTNFVKHLFVFISVARTVETVALSKVFVV